MSNNVKTIAAGLIAAGLLAGCTGTNSHAAPVPIPGLGHPAAPATTETITAKDGIQLPKSVDGFTMPDCFLPYAQDARRAGGQMVYLESGLHPEVSARQACGLLVDRHPGNSRHGVVESRRAHTGVRARPRVRAGG